MPNRSFFQWLILKKCTYLSLLKNKRSLKTYVISRTWETQQSPDISKQNMASIRDTFQLFHCEGLFFPFTHHSQTACWQVRTFPLQTFPLNPTSLHIASMQGTAVVLFLMFNKVYKTRTTHKSFTSHEALGVSQKGVQNPSLCQSSLSAAPFRGCPLWDEDAPMNKWCFHCHAPLSETEPARSNVAWCLRCHS